MSYKTLGFSKATSPKLPVPPLCPGPSPSLGMAAVQRSTARAQKREALAGDPMDEVRKELKACKKMGKIHGGL